MTPEIEDWDRHSDPPHDCDEDCRSCDACYRAVGLTVCAECCPHAEAMRRQAERETSRRARTA